MDKTYIVFSKWSLFSAVTDVPFASFDEMESVLENAKISVVKGRKVYFSCEEGDDQELTWWLEGVINVYDWIPAFLQALVGREYELVFESNPNLESVPFDYQHGI